MIILCTSCGKLKTRPPPMDNQTVKNPCIHAWDCPRKKQRPLKDMFNLVPDNEPYPARHTGRVR